MQFRQRSRTPLVLLLLLICLSGCKVLGMRTIPLDELKASYESSTSRYMMVDGTNVHYRLEGNMEGPTVVMLHGLLASLQTWDGWVDEMKPYFRIVRIDLPGFGLTGPMASKNYTPEYAVEIFEKMRVELDRTYGNFDKVHLIGNSLGGFISWYYATEYPQHVDKLVLIDPIAYTQPVPFIIRFASWPVIGWYAKHQTPRFLIKRNLRVVYGDSDKLTDETIDRYFELLCRDGNRGSMVEYFRTLMKYNHDPRIAAAVPKVKAKTLLMWGTKDRWVPPALVEKWQSDVAGLEVAMVEGAGHIPMEELPAETVRTAYTFLTDGKQLPEREEISEQDTSAPKPFPTAQEEEPPATPENDNSWNEPPANDNARAPDPEPTPEPIPEAPPAVEEPPPPPKPAPVAPKRPGMAEW